MARTKIKVFDVDLNGIKAVAPVNLDATNGMFFEYPKDNVSLVVTNADDTNGIALVIKGVNGISDRSFEIAKSSTVVIGNLESAACKQSDGTVNVNLTLAEGASASGTIFGIQDNV